MDDSELRKVYPQKFYFRLLCRLLYYFGCGDYWYESKPTPTKLKSYMYSFWVAVSNTYLVAELVNEFFAYTRKDLTEKESNDLMQQTIGHTPILCKMFVLFLNKNNVKVVLKRFLEETRTIYTSNEIDKAALAKSIKYCLAVCFVSYGTILSAQLDGIRTHFNEGIPIRIEVTYFPTRAHSGIYINILRFFVDFHWSYLVAIMCTVDSLAISSLIFTEAKFKLVQLYFENIEKTMKSQREILSRTEFDETFKKKFIEGIRLHEDALWSAANIQSSLGMIYSIQIFETLSLLVICLIKMVTSERNILLLVANALFILCVVVLTGTYMLAAGDITDEASKVSTSIFHCGWEMLYQKSKMRTLIVVAIQRSQMPVTMTAFGILELSYVNFISVLRSSYSFFAVMI